jgi:hypothetical protein
MMLGVDQQSRSTSSYGETTARDGEEAEEYRPTADELDKELLGQLHNAALKASETCFEIKKLCATVVVPAGTLIALLSGGRLNLAVFVAALLVVLFFWIADANGYYYQRKLRAKMASVWEDRGRRCRDDWRNKPDDEAVGAFRSAFNNSQWFYLLIALLILIGLALYLADMVATPAPAGKP